jgi:hypothetical protein
LYTHGDTDFRLLLDQFPSESLCQHCDGVFGGRVHEDTVGYSLTIDAAQAELHGFNAMFFGMLTLRGEHKLQ